MTRPLLSRSALLLALVVAVHARALGGAEFHFDDGHGIVRNPHIRDLAEFPRFFVDPSLFGENPTDAMYRPVVLAANALNLRLGGLHPIAFLAWNLLAHAVAALLLLQVLEALTADHDAPFLGALLFGVHPLATEVVNYASARSESMAAAFGLLAVLCFLRYRRSGSIPWLTGLVSAYLLALGSKEVALMVPALMIGLDLAQAGRRTRPAWMAHFCTLSISSVYLIAREYLIDSTVASGTPPRGVSAQVGTQLKGLVHYARAAAMPVDLSVYPQFCESPSPFDSPALLSLLVILSLAALLCHGGSRRRLRLAALGCGWWAACLLPTFVVALNVLVNDHRPYLAMGGLALALTSLPHAPGRANRQRAAILAVALLCAVLSVHRAAAWHSELSLWSEAAREGPLMAPVQHNLAFALQQAGRPGEAIAHYERAIALDPDYARPLTNLGALYREAGTWDRAEAVLRRAVAVDPSGVAALNNLGLVCAALGRADEAIGLYERALAVAPQTAEVWLNLGLALRDAGRSEAAFQSLATALRLDPTLRDRVRPPAPVR